MAFAAARRTRYPNTPKPEIGQVWEDCDRPTTTLKVRGFQKMTRRAWNKRRRLYEHVAYRAAFCDVYESGQRAAQVVRIAVERFVPTKTGYRYLRTEPVTEAS